MVLDHKETYVSISQESGTDVHCIRIFMDEMQSYGYRVDALFGKVGFYLACVLRKIRE